MRVMQHCDMTHLDLAHSAGDEGLEHGAALVVEQVDLIQDHQLHLGFQRA